MALYSHSRISTFEQCPLKFKFNYIDKIETDIEDTIEAFLGSRVHEVLEKLYTDAKFQKIPELKELLEYYDKIWNENWNDAIVIVRKEYDKENYRKMGERFITDYYNRYHPFDDSKTIALETTKTIPLDEEKKYHFHIRIDRLAVKDKVYEIHDYKTANSLPTQEYLDKDRQLAIYAYGIKKMYPDAKKIRLIWHYLAFDKEMCSERTSTQLEELRKDILRSIAEIESCTEFIPKESALCRWCEFRNMCPNFKHLYELEQKDENEYLKDSGVELVNKYSKADHEIKERQEELEKIRQALLEHAEKNDLTIVYGSDVKARVRSYQRLSFPKKDDVQREKFIETIKNIGLFNQLATIDVYELTKKINNKELHPDLIKLLENFIKKEKTTRVTLSKK